MKWPRMKWPRMEWPSYDRDNVCVQDCDRLGAIAPPTMLSRPKNRALATALALSGLIAPISGLHKFYLGQPVWGVLYILLSWTPIPRIASAIEGVWYLTQDLDEFDRNFNANRVIEVAATAAPSFDPEDVAGVAEALRHLDQLRQEGLISEMEFEDKRRTLLDRLS